MPEQGVLPDRLHQIQRPRLVGFSPPLIPKQIILACKATVLPLATGTVDRNLSSKYKLFWLAKLLYYPLPKQIMQ